MGGRGSKSGLSPGGGFGGYGSIQNLIQAANDGGGPAFDVNTDPNQRGDYDDNGNPNLVKYQGQDDDKTASYLSGTDKNIDLNGPQYADGYDYHDLPLNKLLLRLGVTGGPTVLSDSDFNTYVQQTGAQVLYRGWSSQQSIDRFMNATHNHVGNGIFGDGYYFSSDKSVAQSYAGYGSGKITKMALSPSARAIDISTLGQMMRRASPKLQKALAKTGSYGSGRTYGTNLGEAQFALKMGYNVIVSGNFCVSATADAFVVSRKTI